MVNSNLTPSLSLGTQKHSRIGIASFVVGILSFLVLCFGFVLAFVYANSLTSQNLTAQITASSPTIIGFGALLCFSPVLGVVGVVLGILGVVQKNDKKLFAVIGIVLNFLVILVFVVLFLIGLVAQAGSVTL